MDLQSGKSFGKLRLRAFQPYHQLLCMLKHVERVERLHYVHNIDTFNAMSKGVERDIQIFAHNFLNIQRICNPEKVLES